MSKQLDLEKKLSSEDVNYLVARDKYVELAYNVVAYGTEVPDTVRTNLQARGFDLSGSQGASAAENPEEPSSSGSGDDSGAEGPPLYSEEWFDKATIKMLEPELEKYGLSKSGKRDELADRLYEKLIDEGVITDEDSDDE